MHVSQELVCGGAALPQSSCADSGGLFLEHGMNSQYLPETIPLTTSCICCAQVIKYLQTQ